MAIATFTAGEVVAAAKMNALLAAIRTGMGELIETQTPSAVTFSAFASLGSYTHLGFVAYGWYADVASALNIRFNGDSGSNYNYAIKAQKNDGTDSDSNSASATSITIASFLNTSANSESVLRGYIYNYRGTSSYKRLIATGGGNGLVVNVMGQWADTSAITNLRFVYGGNSGTGIVSLYGMND
jgi:hypothetical protein